MRTDLLQQSDPEVLWRSDPEKIEALLAEVGDRNHVRVTVHRLSRAHKFARAIKKRTMDEEGQSILLVPALVKLDELRAMAGMVPRYLQEAMRVCGAELVDVAPNLRTTVGIDYCATQLGGVAIASPAVAKYMALTENSGAPAAGDTTLTAEITTNGLQRAAAIYAHTGGVASYTQTKTFTASGSFTAVQKEGLFDASSAGTMFLESTFTSTALSSGDSIALTHTVNI